MEKPERFLSWAALYDGTRWNALHSNVLLRKFTDRIHPPPTQPYRAQRYLAIESIQNRKSRRKFSTIVDRLSLACLLDFSVFLPLWWLALVFYSPPCVSVPTFLTSDKSQEPSSRCTLYQTSTTTNHFRVTHLIYGRLFLSSVFHSSTWRNAGKLGYPS